MAPVKIVDDVTQSSPAEQQAALDLSLLDESNSDIMYEPMESDKDFFAHNSVETPTASPTPPEPLAAPEPTPAPETQISPAAPEPPVSNDRRVGRAKDTDVPFELPVLEGMDDLPDIEEDELDATNKYPALTPEQTDAYVPKNAVAEPTIPRPPGATNGLPPRPEGYVDPIPRPPGVTNGAPPLQYNVDQSPVSGRRPAFWAERSSKTPVETPKPPAQTGEVAKPPAQTAEQPKAEKPAEQPKAAKPAEKPQAAEKPKTDERNPFGTGNDAIDFSIDGPIDFAEKAAPENFMTSNQIITANDFDKPAPKDPKDFMSSDEIVTGSDFEKKSGEASEQPKRGWIGRVRNLLGGQQ
jgi:hypothetical protein